MQIEIGISEWDIAEMCSDDPNISYEFRFEGMMSDINERIHA